MSKLGLVGISGKSCTHDQSVKPCTISGIYINTGINKILLKISVAMTTRSFLIRYYLLVDCWMQFLQVFHWVLDFAALNLRDGWYLLR